MEVEGVKVVETVEVVDSKWRRICSVRGSFR
jgi:hypothetical protein